MRDIEEIKKTTGLKIKKEGQDGFGGTVYKVTYKNGKPRIDTRIDQALHFIFSTGCGFEHLSVSTPIECPTWEQMCFMKEIFWRDDEVCMQLHPKKEEYVNNHSFCLHIWKPINEKIPTPPSIMVGIRKEHVIEDMEKIQEMYNEMAKW